jgi:hypothetical protein
MGQPGCWCAVDTVAGWKPCLTRLALQCKLYEDNEKVFIGPATIAEPMPSLGVMMVPAKTPLVDALRQTMESLESDGNLRPDDPALAKLKEMLVIRIVERDEAPLATVDDLVDRARR